MKKQILLTLIMGVIVLQSFSDEPKLKERLFEYFDAIQITTNGLSLKPKESSGDWLMSPVLGANGKVCSREEPILIKFKHDVIVDNVASFAFFYLDHPLKDGFFVVVTTYKDKRKRERVMTYGSIFKNNNSDNIDNYIIKDSVGMPLRFWESAKESGVLEMYKSMADTPFIPPSNVINKPIKFNQLGLKSNSNQKTFSKEKLPKPIEQAELLTLPPITEKMSQEQPSQMKKNLALPISIGGFLVLLGGWFFWKKHQ